MLGSGIYSLATVIFVMLAKRIVGEEAGAKFYMAFTTGQMLLTIGYFEIRPFQVTDVKGQYRAEVYFGFRGLSCLAMLICGLIVGVTMTCRWTFRLRFSISVPAPGLSDRKSTRLNSSHSH